MFAAFTVSFDISIIFSYRSISFLCWKSFSEDIIITLLNIKEEGNMERKNMWKEYSPEQLDALEKLSVRYRQCLDRSEEHTSELQSP